MEMSSTEKFFSVLSVNHKKTPLAIRNQFAFTPTQIVDLYQSFAESDRIQFVILSTCNRTEFYFSGIDEGYFISLLAKHANIDIDTALQYIVVSHNETAIKHFMCVAAGIESQILGDYEIVGQIKKAFAVAKSHGQLNGMVEKIFTFALAASKEIKNHTSISDGTASASFFVIHLLKQFLQLEHKKYALTLLGLGKIGINTLKHLQTHLPNIDVCIVNRNDEKAMSLSREYGTRYTHFNQQQDALQQAHILVVATGASTPIIFPEHIANTPIEYIFDLSIPSNVAEQVKEMPGVRVINIDNLSELVNETFKSRKEQLPQALSIINQYYVDFFVWKERRRLYKNESPIKNAL